MTSLTPNKVQTSEASKSGVKLESKAADVAQCCAKRSRVVAGCHD